MSSCMFDCSAGRTRTSDLPLGRAALAAELLRFRRIDWELKSFRGPVTACAVHAVSALGACHIASPCYYICGRGAYRLAGHNAARS